MKRRGLTSSVFLVQSLWFSWASFLAFVSVSAQQLVKFVDVINCAQDDVEAGDRLGPARWHDFPELLIQGPVKIINN